MQLKERKWHECKACGQRTKIAQEESFGCDECKKPIDDQLNSGNREHADYLEVTVHHHSDSAERLHFCSWTCTLKHLPKIKTDYFISLPFITFDGRWPGTTAKDFFSALKPTPQEDRPVSEHRTEMRMREIGDSFCLEPGCEYEGKPAVQGHCFSVLDDETDRYVTRLHERAEAALASERRLAKDDADYLRRLESMYVCAMANWESGLDQLVWLRRKNAELERLTPRPTYPSADHA